MADPAAVTAAVIFCPRAAKVSVMLTEAWPSDCDAFSLAAVISLVTWLPMPRSASLTRSLLLASASRSLASSLMRFLIRFSFSE